MKETMALEIADFNGDGLSDICISGSLEQDNELVLAYWSPTWNETPEPLPFGITAIRQVGDDQIEIIWNAEPGCDYQIEMSTDLQNWNAVGFSRIWIRAGASTESHIVTVPVGAQKIYYRVIRR